MAHMMSSDGDSASGKLSSTEKIEAQHIEAASHLPLADESQENRELEKRTMRQIDRRLLPVLALGYAVSLMDRSNLSVARISGMADDLRLDIGSRYSLVSLIFFIPYVTLQLPFNGVLRKFGPRRCLTFYILSWGSVQIGMSFVPTWGFLLLCRALLGACEAGFFPGMVFVISTWYKRHEVQSRLAFFYLVSIGIGGFTNILAFAIQKLHGKAGLNGWQWIFLIGGLITMVIGAIQWIFISDFPDQNKFLTKEQTALVLERVERDRGDSLPDEITAKRILMHLGDWMVWASGLMFFCSTAATYAMSYFLPVILEGMGWDTSQSLLLTAPPWVAAAVASFLFSLLSDRTKKRAIFIAIQACITLTGLLLATYSKIEGVRYFGLHLVNIGGTSCLPSVLAYNSNNIVTHSKRSASTALVIGFGGIGGIFATTVFRQQDFPKYVNGMWATMGAQFLLLFLVAVTSFTYARRNRLHRQGKWKGPLEGQEGFYYTL